jgi:hypothetical protein
VDTVASSEIHLGTVTSDNNLTPNELGQININGQVTGDFTLGDQVIVHIAGLTDSGATRTANLDADGKFDVSFDSNLLASTATPIITASVVAHDSVGNVSTAAAAHPYTINQDAVVLSGKAIDGYISGASVFYDKNGDGKWEAGEATALTDGSGNFDLTVDSQDLTDVGRIIVHGGVDSFTGQNLTGDLVALKGYTLVTPLTTLLNNFIEYSILIQTCQLKAHFEDF